MTVVQRAGKRQRTDEAGEGGGPDRKGAVAFHSGQKQKGSEA